MIQAILFDADGTLYDSEPLNYESNRVTAKEMYDFDFTWEMFDSRIMRGSGSSTDVMADHGVPVDRDKYLTRRHQHHAKLVKNQLQPLPGLLDFLKWCQQVSIRCVVVSASRLAMLENNLTAIDVKDYFETILSLEDANGHEKPDPFSYELALKTSGLQPDQVLVVEDMAKGIAAAQAAGLFCVGIHNSINNDKDLAAADFTIKDYDELKAYLLAKE